MPGNGHKTIYYQQCQEDHHLIKKETERGEN